MTQAIGRVRSVRRLSSTAGDTKRFGEDCVGAISLDLISY